MSTWVWIQDQVNDLQNVLVRIANGLERIAAALGAERRAGQGDARMSALRGTHFGRDAWSGHRKQWFGPFGIGLQRHEFSVRFWLPSFSWVWGYWR